LAFQRTLAAPTAGNTGAIGWHSDLRAWFNPQTEVDAIPTDVQFSGGAIGDGSTENRAMFSALMAAIPTAAPRKGSRVTIPPGTFRATPPSAFSPAIAADKHGLTISGVNPQASILKMDGSTAGDLLSITGVDHILIENLSFDTNYPTRTAGGASIGLSTCKHVTIRNCWFPNQADIPVSLYRCEDVTVQNCWANNLRLGFVRVQDPGAGGTTRKVWVDDNDVEDWQKGNVAGHAAVQLHGTSTGTIEDIWVRGNRMFSPKTVTSDPCVGVGCDMGINVKVLDNRIRFSGVGEGIAATGSNYEIGHNHVNGGTTAAGVVLWPEGFAPNKRFSVHHNHLWDQAQGVAIVWNTNSQFWEDLDVHANVCWNSAGAGGGPQQYGIQSYLSTGGLTGTGVRRGYIHDNMLVGNQNGAYNLVNSSQFIKRGNVTGDTTLDA
jgi:hypothetical protein